MNDSGKIVKPSKSKAEPFGHGSTLYNNYLKPIIPGTLPPGKPTIYGGFPLTYNQGKWAGTPKGKPAQVF